MADRGGGQSVRGDGVPGLDARLARSDVLSAGHRARAAGMAVRSHARVGRARHRIHPRTDPDGHARAHGRQRLHHSGDAANCSSSPTLPPARRAMRVPWPPAWCRRGEQPDHRAASRRRRQHLNGASAVETMISMLITLVAGFLVLATTSVVALLVMASGGFSAGGHHQRRVECDHERAVTAAARVGRRPAAAKP